MNAPGTAKRTTFLSANSFDALKFCGMPQDVRSEASGVHGTYLQPISQPCDVRTLEDVLVRLRAYEKITPSGNESPALRPDIVKEQNGTDRSDGDDASRLSRTPIYNG